MSTENEIPFSSDYNNNNNNNIIINDTPKKSPLKIILIILGFLVIIVYILILISSFSITLSENNDLNYITAVYQCDHFNSQRYQPFNEYSINYSLLISSITVDGLNVPVTPYHQFNSCDKKK